ncbi:MAG: 2-hydroxypropyl-CoM dehydrogenase [Betaproteobacteria bacterium HGW-Betaproteobacteria-11]|nr:MAG: 2-hydroxypropyl-CoM dehydrogenase [Betaproteobacteria bacterium HGW-Betaproteobacteria-11]
MSRVVIITGAASGNGRAIANRFLNHGDRIAAVDLSAEALEERNEDDWVAHADRIICLPADVAGDSGMESVVRRVVEHYGRIDVLVNNAGITGNQEATSIHVTPIAEFDRVIAVNLRGIFLGCRSTIPVMLKQGGGVIVNIASIAGMVAFPARAAYTASKGAVIQLTRSIAADYAHDGIRCNAICPGMIETPMTQWRLDNPDLRQQVLARIPQKEIGTANDVASAVMFIASPDAHYFNGSALVMDGGYTAI